MTWEALRKQLPYQYCKLISRELDGISARDVHNVFNEIITDPVIVSKVFEATQQLIEQLKKLPRRRKKISGTKKKIFQT